MVRPLLKSGPVNKLQPMKTTHHSFSHSIQTAFAVATVSCCLAGAARAETVVGSGHVISEKRAVSGFSAVDLRGSGDVTIIQGDTEGLVIDAEDNLLPLIESTVGQDGTLHLGFREHQGSIESKKDVVYKLAVKNVERLTVKGSGSIRAASLTSGGAFLVKLPGSGEITVDHLKAPAVNATIDGSGTVKLGGETHNEGVEINGSGNYETKNLRSDEAEIGINGSGEAHVNVTGSLKASINGSGEVSYRGHPNVTKQINGSGEVNPADAKDE